MWKLIDGLPKWVAGVDEYQFGPMSRPDLVITPATDQTVRVKFDKKEHEIVIPRELETETEVTVVIKPLGSGQ